MTILKGPLEIVFNITNKCNFRCLHCFNRSGENLREKELSDKEVLELMEEIKDIKPFNLCFSGGEPLLRKKLLLSCAKQLSNKGIRVSLVTNGYFLDERTVKELKDSGVSDIEVSIDGATPETHEHLRRKKGSFYRALEALKNLKKINFPIYEASFVATKFNIKELGKTILLLEKINVPALYIRPMLIIGTAEKFMKELLPTQYQYREIWRVINKINSNGNYKIKVEFYDPMNHLFIFPQKDFFYGIEIKADGSLILSPHFRIKVGNIRKHRLIEYWRAGLHKVWKLPRIRNLLNKITSHNTLMNLHKNINTFSFDLIDNKYASRF